MVIKVELNQKSIEKAIEQLKHFEQVTLPEMIEKFYDTCFIKFERYCRFYLEESSIGENVKEEIANGWTYTRIKNGAVFTNVADKAVYVEFGVGKIGQKKPHKKASESGYQYNIGRKIREDGTWIFNVSDDDDIDVEQDRILRRTDNTVKTEGSPAIMYAYQSLMDLSEEIDYIWEDIKKRYLG